MDQGFPRGIRLRRRADFLSVQRRGRRFTGQFLVLVFLPTTGDSPRFGLTVSRKVGNSVTRNRVKRALRESIRRQRLGVPSLDMVFIARRKAAFADFERLYDDVGLLLDQVRKRI